MKGFTLIEVLIFGMITAAVLLGVSKLLIRIPQAQQLMARADIPLEGKRAMDQLVSDIKEGVPESFQWQVQSSTASLNFAKPRLNPNTHFYESVPWAYRYRGPDQGLGALVRVIESSETVALDSIEAPTDSAPIFTMDPSLHIVMVDIQYHPTGRPPARLVRRVAISQ